MFLLCHTNPNMLSFDESGQRRTWLMPLNRLLPLGVRHEILYDLEQLRYEGLAGSLGLGGQFKADVLLDGGGNEETFRFKLRLEIPYSRIEFKVGSLQICQRITNCFQVTMYSSRI